MMLTSETEVISLATIIVRSVYTIMDYMLHNVAFEGGEMSQLARTKTNM